MTPRSHGVVTPYQTPGQQPDTLHTATAVEPAAHHRPPTVEYRDGIPYHYTVGQPQSQHVTVQLPDAATIPPWLRELIVIAIVMLTVLVVCTGCIVAVVVLAGGTLMGIIGAASAAALPITAGVVATLAVAGWAATRIRPLLDTARGNEQKEVTR